MYLNEAFDCCHKILSKYSYEIYQHKIDSEKMKDFTAERFGSDEYQNNLA